MTRWNLTIAIVLLSAAGVPVGTGDSLAFDDADYRSVAVEGTDCLWCDLSEADLAEADLTGVDLTGSDLTGADLSRAALRNTDLSGADLTDAVLVNTDFTNANLAGADLNQVDLSRAVLVGAKLEGAYCDWATKLPDGTGLACEGVTLAHK
jgi:uncharacterized protein YjbI with pentapeptide repeats